jgi:hypothetical protein
MSGKPAGACRFFALVTLCVAPLVPAAWASGDPAAENNKATGGKAVIMEMDYQKSMKMDEPMPTGMAKPGMKKGDVKNSAERKQMEMEKMMREEMK